MSIYIQMYTPVCRQGKDLHPAGKRLVHMGVNTHSTGSALYMYICICICTMCIWYMYICEYIMSVRPGTGAG